MNKRPHKYRDKLTTILSHDEIDVTNIARGGEAFHAERALRPATVMRKIIGLMRTTEQQRNDVLETIKTLLEAEWAEKGIALLAD